MLHTPELAGLVQARLIKILKVSKSPHIDNLLSILIRDMKEHMEKTPINRCYRCGHEVRSLEFYCEYCIGQKS